MSECPTHGALLGGYVLGSLEPAEMDEMRRHVAGCPHCGPEADKLGGLPGERMYELWCVRGDGRWVSGGTFRTAASGRAEAMLTAAVRPGDYHVMVVTRHIDGEHGPALLRGELRY